MRVSLIHINSWPVPVYGAATLATVVGDAGHEVQVVDLTFRRRGQLRHVAQALAAHRPDVICLSVFDELARQICRQAKEARPDVTVLFGGSYATLFPDEVIADPAVDAVCVGDGEEAICDYLARRAQGAVREPPPGFWIKVNGVPVEGPLRLPADLARVPAPDWSLWDVERYVESCPVLRGAMFIVASRGCPYACTFCARHTLRRANPGRRYLARPPEQVVREIAALRERYGDKGLRYIFFLDHVFGAQLRWLREFAQRYREAGLATALPWACQARAEHVTAQWAALVSGAGCRLVEFGVETADDARRYQLLNKRTGRAVFGRAAAELRGAGIAFNVYLLAGIPGDTRRELQESVRYAESLGARVIFISRFIPVRGTELGDACRGQGLVAPGPGGEERVVPDRMSERELSALLWWHRLRRVVRMSRLGLREQGLRFATGLIRDAVAVSGPSGIGFTHPLALVSTLDRQVNLGVFQRP